MVFFHKKKNHLRAQGARYSWTIDIATMSFHRFVYVYILTLCRNEEKVAVKKEQNHDMWWNKGTTIPSQIVSDGEIDQGMWDSPAHRLKNFVEHLPGGNS